MTCVSGLARIAAAAALGFALAGCSTYDLPTQPEAKLRVAGGGTVSVSSLSCRLGGSVVAAGVETSGINSLGGVLLRSADRGLHWEMLRPDAALRDVSPWFIEDPRDVNMAPRALYVTGYRNVGLITAAVMWAYSLGPWLVSRDDGKTWRPTDPLAPFAKSTRVEPDPQQVVQSDATGTLAFTRVAGWLNPFANSSVILVRSRDGGRTWQESSLPGITNPPIGLLSDGRGRVVVVATSGSASDAELVVLQSDDGGERWTETLRSKRAGGWWGIAGRVDGTLILWNQGERTGRAYFVSSDGGRTWSGRAIGLWRPFRRVVSAGPGRWVALSVEPAGNEQEAIAWVSDDDGRTWTLRPTGIKRRKQYEAMGHASTLVSAGNGVLIAHAGGSRVARSSDHGETWQLHDAALPDRDFGFNAHCTDGKGLVVLGGDYGLLTRTVDFGVTWQAGRILDVLR